MSRDIRSLGRMNDDRTDLKSFSNAATWFLVIGPRPRYSCHCIFVPLQVWIGEKLLHHCFDVICVRFLANIARSAARS